MMSYLKFALVFIFEIITNNIVKSILLISAIVSFNFAGVFPDTIDDYKIIHQTKIEDTYLYFYKTISDNKIKYENISSDKPIELKNGGIKVSSYNGLNVLFWIIFSVCGIVVLIATFINDSDTGWDVSDAWTDAFSTLIYCEEENGHFYYFALGRLISKTDTQINRRYRITHELNISGFRDLFRCPKYQTKTQRRETLLSKIGIN